MNRRVVQAGVVVAVLALFTVPAAPSQAEPSVPERIVAGTLKPAHLKVPGGVKRMPFLSPGRIDALSTPASARAGISAAHASPGIAVRSAGCAERNNGRNIRVNQDCTYRRQAEEHIAANPNNPRNLVAGMNDSIVGWNRTSLDFSVDGGRHWGAISTAPFGYRLNDPNDLLPTAADPNRHTIKGGTGTLHSYDACSDPYVATDSRGRFFYTCVGFDIASNASLAFVVPSPPGAKGSYFDQVPAPEGLTAPYTGREHIIAEDNSAAASYDAPKVAADAFPRSPNRDNIYFTWTVFNFSCGANHDEFCESPIWGSMSTDHGFTWSTPEEISGSNAAVCTLGNSFNPDLDPGSCNFDGHSDLVVRPNGELAVTFIGQNTPSLNPEILSLRCRPSGSSTAGTAHLNCGASRKVADYVLGPACDFGRGPEQCIPGAYIRAPFETSQRLSVDERTGTLYNTWYDYRNGEFDVFVVRSTDAGATWTAPRQVNRDRGTDHYFSAIDVGERYGTKVAISYYRTGRIPGENTTPPGGFGQDVANQMSDYVLSGGRDLSTPYRFEVLSPKFPPPDGIQAGFNGDYSGIEVDRTGIAHPIWSDTRNRVPNPGFNKVSVDEDVFTVARPFREPTEMSRRRQPWWRRLVALSGRPFRGWMRPGRTVHMQSLYEAAGGSAGLLRLAGAWHERVMADEIVSHAFSHGFHPRHSERLAAYWGEALGGPAIYSDSYGTETSVVRMHSGNGVHEEMDRRAIDCFDQALADAGLTAEPLRQVLHDYFAWMTTTTMSRYHDCADDVPDGLSIPRWSWDGLQR